MRKFTFIIIIPILIFVIYLTKSYTFNLNDTISDYYINNAYKETFCENAVTSIYLNYRIYDTLFEALMLFVSSIAVVYFTWHSEPYNHMKSSSVFLKSIIKYIIPLIIMLGFYITINGPISPGGGFQGGAILSSIMILAYCVKDKKIYRVDRLEKIEKNIYIIFLLLSIFIGFTGWTLNSEYNLIYILFMNLLIGIKVFCGLSIMFEMIYM